MRQRPVVVLACLALLCSTAVPAGERLSAESRVGKDPLIVVLARLDSLMSPVDSVIDLATKFGGEITPEKVEAGFAKLDEELGFSLREDLLRQLGPEFGVVIDLDDLDTVVAKAGGFPGTASEMLAGVGLFAQVRDTERVDFAMRKLALSLGDEVTIDHDAENVATIRIPMKAPLSGVEAQLEIAYSIRSGWLAVGFNEEWVRTTLARPAAGGRLADGEDYARVRAQLDADPDLLAYANLPKLLTRVQGSNMIKMLLGPNAEAQRVFDTFANEETLNVGWGHTSSDVDGAARTTTFGPTALSGGTMYAGIVAAIAIPNFLNAVDRGKQKRTVADVRSIGTAIESFRIDTGLYPTTEGWQTVEAIAGLLEPFYIKTLPRVDGWGHPLRVFADGESYTLASPGKDGKPDREWVGEVETGPTTSWDDDIVFSDGQFLRRPEGP